ncbi:anaerobic C4-dicarboxylate transporter family protein [Citrobacter farmeri]
MVILHVVLLLGTIMLAARWGGIGVGFAGGIGLAISVFIFGVPAGSPPVERDAYYSVNDCGAVGHAAGRWNGLSRHPDRKVITSSSWLP